MGECCRMVWTLGAVCHRWGICIGVCTQYRPYLLCGRTDNIPLGWLSLAQFAGSSPSPETLIQCFVPCISPEKAMRWIMAGLVLDQQVMPISKSGDGLYFHIHSDRKCLSYACQSWFIFLRFTMFLLYVIMDLARSKLFSLDWAQSRCTVRKLSKVSAHCSMGKLWRDCLQTNASVLSPTLGNCVTNQTTESCDRSMWNVCVGAGVS